MTCLSTDQDVALVEFDPETAGLHEFGDFLMQGFHRIGRAGWAEFEAVFASLDGGDVDGPGFGDCSAFFLGYSPALRVRLRGPVSRNDPLSALQGSHETGRAQGQFVFDEADIQTRESRPLGVSEHQPVKFDRGNFRVRDLIKNRVGRMKSELCQFHSGPFDSIPDRGRYLLGRGFKGVERRDGRFPVDTSVLEPAPLEQAQDHQFAKPSAPVVRLRLMKSRW